MSDQHHLKDRALKLINAQSTMSLATARDNHAWAAPVYFVFYKSAFYFFSSSDSRHIQEALDSGQASAAIYPDVSTWQEINGIQMSGRVRPAGLELAAMQAFRAYIAKFNFTKEFFEPGQTLELESFRKRFRVRFYRFDPTLLYYLDNQIEFGFRSKIAL